jgi:hypothetical protein
MAIVDKKKKVFGKIAAAKTLTESKVFKLKNKATNALESINNKGDSITFLTDLIKTLIGYAALVKATVDILTHSIEEIEIEIKKALKLELKSIVSCGIDPSLPSFIKSNSTTGIVIEVKKIDFLDLMKVDPTSVSGKLLYDDASAGLTSSDFNTFLYAVIQDDGATHTWQNIFDFTFVSLDPNGVNPNNSIVIKANPTYDSKTLNDLNNNFVDSLKLFNTKGLVNKIINTIFGSISFSLGKTSKQLESEAKIDAVVDKIVNADESQTISDTYFTFDNEENSKIQREADERKRGIIKIKASTTFDASVPESSLTSFNNEMGTAVTTQQKKEVLASNLDKMADNTTDKSPNPQDKISIKLNFIQNIINTLIKSIVGVVLSPKVVLIFLVNFKIVYGPTVTYGDGVDFMKKNKALFKRIIKKITTMIIKYLLVIALKKIAELVGKVQVKKQIEKGKDKLAQMLTLIGVPQEAIRIIKGLG